MKNKTAVLLIFSLAVCLCACGAKADPPGPDTSLAVYTAVLNGSREAFLSDSQVYRDISQLVHVITAEDVAWNTSRITVLDLDGDGTDEVVAEVLLEDWGDVDYVVLHSADGEVYAQSFSSVAFHDLKADGSYRFTVPGFSTHYGYGRKQFTDGAWTYTFTAECCSDFSTDPETGTLVYLIDGQPVDAAAFAEYEARHDTKPDPIWYDSWEALLAAQE